MKALREEINAILINKLKDAIEAFEASRNQNFDELIVVKGEVENLQAQKAGIVEAMGKLNIGKSRDLGEHNRLTQKASWLNRQVKGKQDQVEKLMEKLTSIHVDPQTLLLLTYHGKGGGKDEKEG